MIKFNLNTEALRKMAARARGQAGTEIRKEVYKLADEVVATARPQWPVDTRRSRDALKAYRGRISNKMPYTKFIHFARGGRNVWRALIVEPARRLLRNKKAQLQRRYARALRGR